MGDPRKHRRKYSTPSHPWQKERIERENKLKEDYGLKNKKELWRHDSMLKQMKMQTKSLTRRQDKQADTERELFFKRLERLGLLQPGSKLESILELKLENILDRRLQTMVVKKGLARSMTQARQFVVHGHVMVKGKKVDVPSYLVFADEENSLTFDEKSPFADPEHPERQTKQKEVKVEAKEEAAEELIVE